jgi:hypothetical protein
MQYDWAFKYLGGDIGGEVRGDDGMDVDGGLISLIAGLPAIVWRMRAAIASDLVKEMRCTAKKIEMNLLFRITLKSDHFLRDSIFQNDKKS